MKENKIPTAKEFYLQEIQNQNNSTINISESIQNMMIEFAKMHVEKALEEAAKKAEIDSVDSFTQGITFYVSERSIVNSYPLENIK